MRIGVAGLGRAFTLMLRTFRTDPRVALVAAADGRREARELFARDFGGRAYEDVDALVGDAEVEAVYVATPHPLHAEHAIAAARAGKHVLVEKPMAISLAQAQSMIAAARDAGVHLVVGPSHSFDAPIAAARRLIDSGEVGAVRMITALNFTDFLYRPRRPEELDTAQGGGVVFSQAAHQVDIARVIAGSPVTHVRAATGAWDPRRPTEGAYSALLTFESGAFATLVYSGYAHFDSDELCGGIGELGKEKAADTASSARRTLEGLDAQGESDAKNARNYGGDTFRDGAAPQWHEHFGPLIVSCEKADLRPLPNGIWVHADAGKRFIALDPPSVPRVEVIDELYAAVVDGRKPLHDGAWGAATLAVCLAILESSRTGREIP